MCEPFVAERSATTRPRWGLLYGTVGSPLLALLVVEATAPPFPARTLLRCALALAAFGGMAAWVWSSRAALDLQEWCPCAASTISVRVIESERPADVPCPAEEPEPEVRAPAERELVLR